MNRYYEMVPKGSIFGRPVRFEYKNENGVTFCRNADNVWSEWEVSNGPEPGMKVANNQSAPRRPHVYDR